MGKKSSISLLLTVIFPLAWRSTDTGLRRHRHESLANCFFPALCYIKSHSSGSKNRIVRAVPIVLTNKVYHSISDDFKTVWVAALWNACEILWWRYAENFWKWNFCISQQWLGITVLWKTCPFALWNKGFHNFSLWRGGLKRSSEKQYKLSEVPEGA